MARLQHITNDVPKFRQTLPIVFKKLESFAGSAFNLAVPQISVKRILQQYGGRKGAALQPGTGAEEPIEVFIRRVIVVDIGRWLILKGATSLFQKMRCQQAHHLSHLGRLCVYAEHQAAVCQAAMRLNQSFVALNIGWQQAPHAAFFIKEEQGSVFEAVFVVFHERALEKEGAVSRFTYKLVPSRSIPFFIGNGFHC